MIRPGNNLAGAECFLQWLEVILKALLSGPLNRPQRPKFQWSSASRDSISFISKSQQKLKVSVWSWFGKQVQDITYRKVGENKSCWPSQRLSRVGSSSLPSFSESKGAQPWRRLHIRGHFADFFFLFYFTPTQRCCALTQTEKAGSSFHTRITALRM